MLTNGRKICRKMSNENKKQMKAMKEYTRIKQATCIELYTMIQANKQEDFLVKDKQIKQNI